MSTTLGVHIGWDANLPDQYVKYSDVSGYVTQVDTQRGRSTELDDIQTGTATVVLDNSDGRFTPGRAYGKELLPDNVRTSSAFAQSGSNGFTPGTNTALHSASSPTLSWQRSLQAIVSTAVAGNRIVRTAAVPVKPGLQYRASVMATVSTGTAQAQAAIRFYDSSGNDLGNGTDYDTTWKQYADVVRASMPVAYHRMNDAGGNSCAPTAGRDPMVTYNVTAGAAGSSWAAGGTASVGVFNGTSSIAEPCGIPLATVVNNSASAGTSSVELWFNTTTPGGLLADAPSAVMSSNFSNPVQYTISSAGAPVTGGALIPVVHIGTDGYLYCEGTGKSLFPVNDGLWHHLVNAGGVYYLDGVQFFTGSRKFSRPVLGYVDFTASGTWTAKPSTGWFNGRMADVALYRHALTPQTIADHYRHGVAGPRPVQSIGSTYPLPWGLLTSGVTAPANAFTASVEVVTSNAGTFYFDSFSLRTVSPFYGRIRPRRRVRVFATTGQNLMPPGLNLGYQTYSGIPAGVDDNETGTWVLASGTNLGFDPSSNVTTYAANSNTVSGLSLYGPSGNGISVPWMLLPGNTYVFQCQVACWRFATNSTGVTIGINTTVNSSPGSSTYFNGSVPVQHINKGDVSWKTVSYTFTIPTTYTQPEFLFTVFTSETVSSGTFAWQTALRNLQLVDVTNGQTIPAYQPGDATMPVFVGVADKWESTTEYDQTATVQLSCSDMMRALGESQMSSAPQSLGFRPDWNCLGSWDLSQEDQFDNIANEAPNQLFGTANLHTANTAAVNNLFTSEYPNVSLTGRYLPQGNGGINFQTGLCQYLLSFGKLAAKGSLEFWFRPYNNAGSPDVWNGGDNLICGSGPLLSMYIGSGGTGQVSCGWNGRKATSTNIAPGSPGNLMTRGGHVAMEVITSGGASPTVSVQVFYNGTSVVSSSGEAFGPVTQQYNGNYSALSIGGDRNFTDPISGTSLPQFCGEVYAPAMYGNTGMDWATRVNLFSVSIGNPANTPVNNGSVISATQTQLPWIVAASGMPLPITVGSQSSPADVPVFSGGTGLDAFKAQAAQTMGMVVFNRYGALSIQDSTFRQSGNDVYSFDCTGATGPDSAMLYVNDIDRTWTSVQLSGDNGTTTWNSFAGWAQYGWHQQSQTVQNTTAATGGYAWGFLANYLQPTARIDSASFTVNNNALAATALLIDIGSHVQFMDLPDNAPADGPYQAYMCWAESVKVSAQAQGGVIVPTVQVTLSPDFTYVPIM
jgi:hypothetical protein